MLIFSKHLGDIQIQLISIVLVVLIITSLTFVIYSKLRKIKVDEAPTGILLLAEQYVMGIDSLFKSVAKDTISPMAPYIFTLFTFLLTGNLIGIIGFPEPVTSYSVPLVLGFISWCGIYVTGVIYQKMRFFKKYLNPLDFLGQFSPFISISFRIFGNIIGGTTIIFLVYTLMDNLWSNIWLHIPGLHFLAIVDLLPALLAPPFHAYFDLFGGIIQAFVFTLLTIVYWSVEATHTDSAGQKKTKKITVYTSQSHGPHKVRTS